MSEKNISFAIQGMHCASCAAKIEKTFKTNAQVSNISVNFASSRALVESTLTFEEIKKIIQDLGYQAYSLQEKNTQDQDLEARKNEILIALSCSFVVFLISMVFHIETLWGFTVQALLSSIVLFYPGRYFFISAWKNLKKLSTNMDTLIALGSGSAYGYSFMALFQDEPLYFETASLIISFVLVGNYLERKSKQKSNEALNQLIQMTPQVGRVIKGKEEQVVPISEIHVGDHLLIKPGEHIPLDGKVVEGISSIDESTMTGESLPSEKKEGDYVYAATINKSGALHIEVTKKNTETLFAKLIELVDRAQSSKGRYQRLADVVSSYFVPAICVLSVLTFVGWFLNDDVSLALKYAIAVLVIACPCALGLATPIAVVTAVGQAARRGILFKNAEVLNLLSKTKVLFFDKTGTITRAHPVVHQVVPLSKKFTVKDILKLASAGEKKSEHPLSIAVVERAKALSLEIDSALHFKNFEGKGISFQVASRSLLVGNEVFMKENNIPLENSQRTLEEFKNFAFTTVFVSIDGVLEGVLLISDEIRENVRETIQKLKQLSIHPMMVTGDNPQTAKAVAAIIGVEDTFANLKPDEKLEKIKEYQRRGHVTAMVGDGVNDAPALATSDVGIAVEGGSHIALESADVTLLKGDFSRIVSVFEIARKSVRIMKQNLFWAFFYNVVAIPFAALGYLHPVLAAAAMSASSLTVVFNALRLRKS
ncbi:MAG: cation-translocating P-type ATPase [Deltaproteobacteria bacterium]|nr:cation-translocating P-type ATPase [Deltaproteobacteria bacterium]